MQDVILIDVPEGASEFAIIHNGTRVAHFRPTYKRYDLPPGSWTIVEQTEEGAAEIIERWDSGKFTDYERFLARVDTALASLHSWIRSQGKEPKTSIILKKEI
jgi:hypothetical protein